MVPLAPGFLGWTMAALMASASVTEPRPGDDQGRVIERIVALVDGTVITLSELEFEARVALIQGGGVQAATAQLDEQALRGALDLAIGERLETDAADKLQAFPLEEGEVEGAVRAFRTKFDGDAEFALFLGRHEADLQQLSAVLARRLRAEKILDSKIRLRARVTEADVKRFYEERRSSLSGSYEELRPSLREKLVRDRYAALAHEELIQIRKGVQVRMVAPFARAPAAAGESR